MIHKIAVKTCHLNSFVRNFISLHMITNRMQQTAWFKSSNFLKASCTLKCHSGLMNKGSAIDVKSMSPVCVRNAIHLYLWVFKVLTVNGICLFWQLNGIWGVVVPPLRSQELQKVWPWNFYHMLVSIRRQEIKKNVDITGPVCKLQTKNILKTPDFWKCKRNFAGLSLLASEINPEKFRSISQRLTILQKSL